MKTIDLKQCLKVLALQQSRGRMESKIGLLSANAPTHLNHLKKEPILFSVSQYDDGTACVERAMSDSDLEHQKTKGSHLTTTCTMIGVPDSLITEVDLGDLLQENIALKLEIEQYKAKLFEQTW